MQSDVDQATIMLISNVVYMQKHDLECSKKHVIDIVIVVKILPSD